MKYAAVEDGHCDEIARARERVCLTEVHINAIAEAKKDAEAKGQNSGIERRG